MPPLVPTEAELAQLAAQRAVIAERTAASAPPVVVPPVDPPPVTPPVVTPPSSSPLLATFTAKCLAALDVMEKPVHPGVTGDKDKRTFASAEYWLAYYGDVTERLLELYALTGDQRYLTAAKRESKRFQSTLVWTGDRCVVRYPSKESNPASAPIAWQPPAIIEPSMLRRNGAKGLYRLFQATGDPEAKRCALGSANAMLAALPAYLKPEGSPPVPRARWNERNDAFLIAAMNVGTKLEPAKFAPHLATLVRDTVAWNVASPPGNFQHDGRQDPWECSSKDGQSLVPMLGGSPFMTALLVYELWDAAPQDPGVRAAIVRASTWLAANRMRDIGKAASTPLTSYRYLVGCPTDPVADWKMDLNPSIAPVHELASRISGDPVHKLVGDEMMRLGLQESSGQGDPKHFSQLALASRAFL